MSAVRCRRISLLLLALLAPASAEVFAQGIEGLLPTPAEIPYRGRKVVIDFVPGGPRVTSLSVLCQPDGRERRESRATHDILIFDGTSSWQYLPEKGIVLKRPSRGEGGEVLRPEQVRRALASYEVRREPGATIAGRRSRALEFTPRQGGSRPRRRVWVDVETGLILRTEVYGTDSRLARLSVFEDLEYRPAVDRGAFLMRVPRGVRVVEAGAEPCLEPAEAERVSGIPVALPAYLPAGFERQCIKARRARDYGEIQVVFGDGLSLLSLFSSTKFHNLDGGGAGVALADIGHGTGQWHDLGLVSGISWRAPWAHMALLGELSRGELHKVVGSVRPPGEPSPPTGRP